MASKLQVLVFRVFAKKWPLSLPKLEYCIEKIEQFCPQFHPASYIDSKEYLEQRQRYAVVFKKMKLFKLKKAIKSSKLSRECLRV